MISAVSLYNDVSYRINKEEGGYLSYDDFNRISWLAQLSLLDWLSGDVGGQTLPQPYGTEKNRAWLSDFVVKKPAQITNGTLRKPDDFYLFQNIAKISGKRKAMCDEDEDVYIPNKPIELLDTSKFNYRVATFIEELKPKNKYITKEVGRDFEFEPKDLGSVMLEYIRYPQRAEIVTKHDDLYNDEIPDLDLTTDFEWGEYARNALVYFCVREFSMHIRERALFEENIAVNTK